jgi:hypothetical protein
MLPRTIEAGMALQTLTDDGKRTIGAIAQRHGVSSEAAQVVLAALAAGGGRQAQFSHPELGGMGQWSQGGMIMIGEMFNQGLKHRVDQLCIELAGVLANHSPYAPTPSSTQHQSQSNEPSPSLFVAGGASDRWPSELGAPASTGSQNDLHYAVFPGKQRLAISQNGRVTVYDTGDHRISGFSQQQSSDQSLTFTSQHGRVALADLKIVSPEPGSAPASDVPVSPSQATAKTADHAPAEPTQKVPAPGARHPGEDIFSAIERLAELKNKDIITAAEFDAKKAELMARL